MKAPRLLDAATAQILGFNWLRDAVAPVSPYGERVFEEIAPFAAGEEAAAGLRARRIAKIGAALDGDRLDAVRGTLAELPDAASAIARASMGDVLDDPSFLELRRFCEALERIDELLAQCGAFSSICSAGVGLVGEALAAGRRAQMGFYLADEFDIALGPARVRLAQAQAELDAARGRELGRAAQELGRDEIASDEFIVMRAQLRGPLPTGIRVVRETPTYLLCELEYGDASLAALARRQAAADAVASAEERVRVRLSSIVREHAAELEAAARALGQLDVELAAARFTARHECTAAEIASEPVLSFEKARFLPLEAELAGAGRDFVPLDLELHDAAVLTGPNMGGKSVSLQTCGFVALCAALGLPAPVARARCALFDQIAWLGLGREIEIGGLLSSFAREVIELREILTAGAPRLLIFVDEFARTTTPHEGRALLAALLGRLRRRGACGLLATHLAGIAELAGVRHFAVRGLREIPQLPPTGDIGEALTALAASMDYRISEVSGDDLPRADAIALTALLGMDREFVEAAYRALSQ